MVDDFTSKNTKSRFDSPAGNELFQCVKGLTIVLGENWILSLLAGESDHGDRGQKLGDFRVEITDVLIGPF
jgi:hypothetical protein